MYIYYILNNIEVGLLLVLLYGYYLFYFMLLWWVNCGDFFVFWEILLIINFGVFIDVCKGFLVYFCNCFERIV